MYFGVDYYPEHWPKERMARDIELMKELGITVVRMAEFAWTLMEPVEGEFDFSYFDDVIEKLSEAGIDVVLGTPSATPPVWLTEKYPQMLQVDDNNLVRAFGSRRHCCTSNEVYRRYSNIMAEEMIKHYGNHSSVIGWQVDNEIGHEGSDICFCESCRLGFQKWLKEKYEDIDDLNKRWGTVFWSQKYSRFDQVVLPVNTTVMHNPSLELDYYRFRSDSMVEFSNQQVEIINHYKKENDFVTTNLYGGFLEKVLNHDDLMENYDLVSYDNYPVWGGLAEPVTPAYLNLTLKWMRGIKQKNYWVMEQLSGAQGHNVIGYLPRKGHIKLWTSQAIATGAEGIVFFRWRPALFGTEEFCLGVLDHDGEPRRKYYEIKEIIDSFKAIADDFAYGDIKSEVAFVYDWDNMWSWRTQPLSSAFSMTKEIEKFYQPIHRFNASCDVISTAKSFSGYKLLVMPVMTMLSDELIEKVKRFVNKGGTLILTYRTGLKNVDNTLFEDVYPGPLKKLAGIEVLEYESLQQGQSAKVTARKGLFKNSDFKANVWRDIITATTAKSIAHYHDAWEGEAVTVNNYGEGKVYYIGASLEDRFMDLLYEYILSESEVQTERTPQGVEIIHRCGKESNYKFVMNHNEYDVEYSGMTLKAYDVQILRVDK